MTGFLIEDERGQEFVVVCKQPARQLGKVFALRGWQRRRMIPLQCTEQELRNITGEVLMTLEGLLQGLPNVCEEPRRR